MDVYPICCFQNYVLHLPTLTSTSHETFASSSAVFISLLYLLKYIKVPNANRFIPFRSFFTKFLVKSLQVSIILCVIPYTKVIASKLRETSAKLFLSGCSTMVSGSFWRRRRCRQHGYCHMGDRCDITEMRESYPMRRGERVKVIRLKSLPRRGFVGSLCSSNCKRP